MELQEEKTKLPHETIWIIGGGKFGRRAAEQLQKKSPDAAITMVEKQPIAHFPDGIETVCAEGIEWFAKNFSPESPVTRIIPALPLHLAADWIKKKLSGEGKTVRSIEIPDDMLNRFPHPFRISAHRIAISHADFLCPPDCPEPDEICTYTKEKRPQPLYSLLETVDYSTFIPLIVRSRQFAPGVGGFFPEDLWNLLDRVRLNPQTSLLIGTACKCHGIVDGLYLTPWDSAQRVYFDTTHRA